MVYFQNGDYPNAVAELKQAYQIKRIPGLLFNIGQTYRKMDDTDMSIFYFDKFIKEAPPTAPHSGHCSVTSSCRSTPPRTSCSPPA